MRQPPQDVDTLFEDLVQDLPPETVPMAREFTAFTRARELKTPVPLLRLVWRYGGLEQSRREVAGRMTLLVERITESAVAERLAARPVAGDGLRGGSGESAEFLTSVKGVVAMFAPIHSP